MTETLSFPGLGLEFEIDRVAFTVGDWPIYWYGIIIAAAFLLGALYILRRARTFGLDPDRVMDVVIGGVLIGIVGARAYYVMFRWDSFSQNLASVFDIRSGGIAIYGGIIAGVAAAVLICKWRKVKLLPMLDLAAGGLFIGQAIGRWGNFINIEVFGGNTTAPWGMTSPSISWYLNQNLTDLTRIGMTVDPSRPVHPTFFYESMWCLAGFLFILWYTRRRRFDGELGLIYLGWYGLGRFFIEGMRTDSLLLGTIRVSQALALLCVIASVCVLVVVHSKIKRANDPEYLQLYIQTGEAIAVLNGEFYAKKNETLRESDEGDEKPETVEKNTAEKDDETEEKQETAEELLNRIEQEIQEEQSLQNGQDDELDGEDN